MEYAEKLRSELQKRNAMTELEKCEQEFRTLVLASEDVRLPWVMRVRSLADATELMILITKLKNVRDGIAV